MAEGDEGNVSAGGTWSGNLCWVRGRRRDVGSNLPAAARSCARSANPGEAEQGWRPRRLRPDRTRGFARMFPTCTRTVFWLMKSRSSDLAIRPALGDEGEHLVLRRDSRTYPYGRGRLADDARTRADGVVPAAGAAGARRPRREASSFLGQRIIALPASSLSSRNIGRAARPSAIVAAALQRRPAFAARCGPRRAEDGLASRQRARRASYGFAS